MPAKRSTAPKYVTEKFLKKETNRLEKEIKQLDTKIDGVEKRLDSKIDIAVQSMKDYTDSRFTQLDQKLDTLEHGIMVMLDNIYNNQVK